MCAAVATLKAKQPPSSSLKRKRACFEEDEQVQVSQMINELLEDAASCINNADLSDEDDDDIEETEEFCSTSSYQLSNNCFTASASNSLRCASIVTPPRNPSTSSSRNCDSPPEAKRARRKLEFNSSPARQQHVTRQSLQTKLVQFTSTLKVTKDVTCSVCFTLLPPPTLSKLLPKSSSSPQLSPDFASRQPTIVEQDAIPAHLFTSPVNLRVADFASKDLLSSVTLVSNTASTLLVAPEFEIQGLNETSRCALSYLRGLLTRKDEVAMVPIENSQYQLLIYEKDLFSNGSSNSVARDSFELLQQEYTSLNTNLHAVLVKKFSIVFDLDETLIRTRIPKPQEQEIAQKGEFEFFVQGHRYACCVRPGTDLLLKWASQMFQVYIFTNSIFEYAKEVCKILDPTRETILYNIENDEQLRKFLKTRELMTPVDFIPKPLGLKDLAKFYIGIFDTVILDDDVKVWKDRDNILPFEQITQFKAPNDFFYRVRLETWKLLSQLARKRIKALQQQQESAQCVKQEPVIIESVQILSQQQPLVVSYSQQHVMETATAAKQAASCLDEDSDNDTL